MNKIRKLSKKEQNTVEGENRDREKCRNTWS